MFLKSPWTLKRRANLLLESRNKNMAYTDHKLEKRMSETKTIIAWHAKKD